MWHRVPVSRRCLLFIMDESWGRDAGIVTWQLSNARLGQRHCPTAADRHGIMKVLVWARCADPCISKASMSAFADLNHISVWSQSSWAVQRTHRPFGPRRCTAGCLGLLRMKFRTQSPPSVTDVEVAAAAAADDDDDTADDLLLGGGAADDDVAAACDELATSTNS